MAMTGWRRLLSALPCQARPVVVIGMGVCLLGSTRDFNRAEFMLPSMPSRSETFLLDVRVPVQF